MRAHLEHLLLYSGEKLDNPVAERTRKVQEWGVLTKWQSRFTKPITFSDLAAQWAPGSGGYARMLDGIAERFQEFCDKPDPRPELAAAVRRELRLAEARAEQPSGQELAKRAIEEGKADETARRSSLGVQETASVRPRPRLPPMPFKVLNAPPPEADKFAVAERRPTRRPRPIPWRQRSSRPPPRPRPRRRPRQPPAARPLHAQDDASRPPSGEAAVQDGVCRRRRQAAGRGRPAAAAGQKCRVWTASYGGQKALIIRSVIDKVVNYTVLDVNEGAEKREADAFISAYAKEGAIAGEFGSQAVGTRQGLRALPRRLEPAQSDGVPMPIRPTRKALLIGACWPPSAPATAGIGARRRRCPRSASRPGRRCRPASRPAG